VCGPCPVRTDCTRAKHTGRRLRLPPQDQYEALQAAQTWSASEEGQQLYKRRAGVEGTLSQGVRAFGLRRTRYGGVAKTHLQHVAIAAAINMTLGKQTCKIPGGVSNACSRRDQVRVGAFR
jgi:transposase